MIKITGIDHIVLKTADREKMLAFYCDILGCSIEKEQPDFHLTQLRAGDNLIDLIEDKNYQMPVQKNMEHFCLRIQDFNFDELQPYLEKHSVTPQGYGKRYSAQGQGYSFYINDPEGNTVELTAAK